MGSNPEKKTRFMIKLIIIFFIIACAGPFFIKDKRGRSFMSFGKIKVSALNKYSELKHFLKLDTVPEAESDNVTEDYIPYENREYTEMYKYRDEKGVLHFTDKKPQKVQYEILYTPVSKESGTVGKTVDGIIGKVFKKKNNKKSEKKSSLSGNPKTGAPLKTGNILSGAKQMLESAADQYKNAPNALEDAKELKKQVEDVHQERGKMMENM